MLHARRQHRRHPPCAGAAASDPDRRPRDRLRSAPDRDAVSPVNEQPAGLDSRVDIWRLPEVVSVEAAPVRYPQPRAFYAGGRRRDVLEVVELLVRTAGMLPE